MGGGGGGKKISPQINNLTILRPSALLVRNWLKPRFHSSQKPTRKLTESAFKYCDWMKVLEASLQVGFCDEWKRAFRCLWISCIYIHLPSPAVLAFSIKEFMIKSGTKQKTLAVRKS